MIFLSVAIFDATFPTKKAVLSVVPHIVVPILGLRPISALLLCGVTLSKCARIVNILNMF